MTITLYVVGVNLHRALSLQHLMAQSVHSEHCNEPLCMYIQSNSNQILLVSTATAALGTRTPIFYLAHHILQEGLHQQEVIIVMIMMMIEKFARTMPRQYSFAGSPGPS